MELVALFSARLDDYVAGLSWSADGTCLAAMPASGSLAIFDVATEKRVHAYSGSLLGNGQVAFHPKESLLAFCRQDGWLRVYRPPFPAPLAEVNLKSSWLDQVAWNVTGERLATAVGKHLLVFDAALQLLWESPEQSGSIHGFAWNPANPNELCTVGGGGAQMWRVGEKKPYARMDWGGASLQVCWSNDGRWIATTDQTPSVHIYDFRRNYPLHIQGYATKVRAMAFHSNSRYLATGGGDLVTEWSCTGKKGPEGSTPRQLTGHLGESIALAYQAEEGILASGGTDSLLNFYHPSRSLTPFETVKLPDEVVTVAWSKEGTCLAAGCADGTLELYQLWER